MTGNRLIDNVILGISFVLVALGTGLTAYRVVLFERPSPDEARELAKFKSDRPEQLVPKSHKLKPLIINIQSRSRRLRFLDVETHVIPFKEEGLEIIKENEDQIRDIMIDTAGRMKPEELQSISGKIILETRIKNRISSRVKKGLVKKILYTKFIVQ